MSHDVPNMTVDMCIVLVSLSLNNNSLHCMDQVDKCMAESSVMSAKVQSLTAAVSKLEDQKFR